MNVKLKDVINKRDIHGGYGANTIPALIKKNPYQDWRSNKGWKQVMLELDYFSRPCLNGEPLQMVFHAKWLTAKKDIFDKIDGPAIVCRTSDGRLVLVPLPSVRLKK